MRDNRDKREQEVLISIRGTQTMHGNEPQTVELLTGGTFSSKNGEYTVSYVESEVTGMEGVHTTFEVEKDRITLRREGSLDSTMVFEVGKLNESLYDMGFGALLVGVQASHVESDLHEDGGSFSFDYAVQIEQEPVGINRYEVSVKPKKSRSSLIDTETTLLEQLSERDKTVS